jgi:hypothetical protein
VRRATVGALLAFLAPTAHPGDVPSESFGPAWDRCIADPRVQEQEYPRDGLDWYLDDSLSGAVPEDEKKPGLTELCPDLRAAIAASDLAPFLPADWDEKVTTGKLLRLGKLLTGKSRPPGRRPDSSAIAGIVERMQKAQVVRERTLWERFKDWLKQLFAGRAADSESGWLADWLREHAPTERVIRWIMYGLTVALIGTIAWIVYVELRAAGLLGRPRPGRAVGEAIAGARDSSRREPMLADASEDELPSLLIALVLGELRRLGRVQDRLSMTHRELARAARFDVAGERDTFRDLLAVSERLRYDAVAPAGSSLRRVIEEARRLLDSLVGLPRKAA